MSQNLVFFWHATFLSQFLSSATSVTLCLCSTSLDSTRGMEPTTVLPPEMHQKILEHVDFNGLIRLRLVSKAWNHLACDVVRSRGYSITLRNEHIRTFTSAFANSFPPFIFYKVKTNCLGSRKLVKILIRLASSFRKLELLSFNVSHEFRALCSKERFSRNLQDLLTAFTGLKSLTFTGSAYLPVLHHIFSSLNFGAIPTLKFAQLEWTSDLENSDCLSIFHQVNETYPFLRVKIELSLNCQKPNDFVQMAVFVPRSFELSLNVNSEDSTVNNGHVLFSVPVTPTKLKFHGQNAFHDQLTNDINRNVLQWTTKNAKMLKNLEFRILRRDWLVTGVQSMKFQSLNRLHIEVSGQRWEESRRKETFPLPVLNGSNFSCLQVLELYNTSDKIDNYRSGFTCGIFPSLTTLNVYKVHLDVVKYSMTCCPKLQNLKITLPRSNDVTATLVAFRKLKSLRLKILAVDKKEQSASDTETRRPCKTHVKERTPQEIRENRRVLSQKETETNVSQELKRMRSLNHLEVSCLSSEVNWLRILANASSGPDRNFLSSLTTNLNKNFNIESNEPYLRLLREAHNDVHIRWDILD